MSVRPAFLSPLLPFARATQHALLSPRRPARRAAQTAACLPSGDHDSENDARPFQINASSTGPANPPGRDNPPAADVFDDRDDTFIELDEIAEEWIGADIAKWEWYERMKARRQKMLGVVKKQEHQLNQEFEELRRTFMEFDAVFGTSMLDEQTSISPAGWSTVALIMLAYVGFGYWMFEFVVKACTHYSPGFPL